jgi:hypothetical protein
MGLQLIRECIHFYNFVIIRKMDNACIESVQVKQISKRR